MFKGMSTVEIEVTDGWVPLAIFKRPITWFQRPGLTSHEGIDGLDLYKGVFGRAENRLVALKEHRGNPADRVTLYIPLRHPGMNPSLAERQAMGVHLRFVSKTFGLDDVDVEWRLPFEEAA